MRSVRLKWPLTTTIHKIYHPTVILLIREFILRDELLVYQPVQLIACHNAARHSDTARQYWYL